MIADTYHGKKAAIYDESRVGTAAWEAEHKAVESLLSDGPVIDVPCGTGRFVELYRRRGIDAVGVDISHDMLAIAKRNGMKCQHGSIYDLRGRYHTAVCIRFFHLVEAPEVLRAMASLAAISEHVIFTMRINDREGKARGWNTYSHTEDTLLDSLSGIMITDRILIDDTTAGKHYVMRARHVTRADVDQQFSDRPAGTIEKLLGEWGARIGVESRSFDRVRCEYWSAEKIRAVLAECAERDPAMIRSKPPRRMDGPLTCWRVDGKHGLIDGRHRANILQHKPGRYPVLVCE